MALLNTMVNFNKNTYISAEHFINHLLNTQYQFFQNPHFCNILPYRNGSDGLEKIISTFFSCDFTIITGDGNTNYIVLFIVSRFSTQIQLSISGFLTVMVKPIRNAYLDIVKNDWTLIVF